MTTVILPYQDDELSSKLVGHSQDEKKANHERIVEIAAARMRESGRRRPGVAEIMQRGRADPRRLLQALRLARRARRGGRRARVRASARRTADALDGAEDPLAAFADFYLSAAHRDGAADGCAVAGLGPDAARGDERIRAQFEAGVQGYLARLEDMLGSRDDAVVALSSMVGALLLARAVDDPELSEEFLAGVREAVVTAR